MKSVKVRELLNMTQKDFASFLGVSVRTVQNWDLRDCMPAYIETLCLKIHSLQFDISILKKQNDALLKAIDGK